MNNIVQITYLLSQKGQKESIRQGMEGTGLQIIIAPVTEELLYFADVDRYGGLYWNVGYRKEWRLYSIWPYYVGHAFDSPQTVESLIFWASKNKKRPSFWSRLFSFFAKEA